MDPGQVTALVSFCELATTLARAGSTVAQHLDSLYNKSVPSLLPSAFRLPNEGAQVRILPNRQLVLHLPRPRTNEPDLPNPPPIRTSPPSFPASPNTPLTPALQSSESPMGFRLPHTLAGFPLTRIRDLTTGYDSSNPPSFFPSLPVDPSTHMISFALGDATEGVEVVGTVRTSGTEPKVRFFSLSLSLGVGG